MIDPFSKVFWFLDFGSGALFFCFGEPTIKHRKVAGSMLVVGHSVLWWLIFSRWCLVTSKWAKKLPFSLLYNEEMSNWLVIERFPVFWMGWNQLDSQSSRNAFHSLSCSSNAYGRSFDCELRPREGTDGQGRFLGDFLAEDMGRRFKMHVYIYIIVFIYTYFYKDKELSWDYVHKTE